MAKTLKFSPQLRLPIEAVTQQFAFIGRTGSGKSYGAGVLTECLLDAKAQVVVLDPVGNWWGLRVGAKGGDGFNIPVFGGRHGDVPLEPEAGAMIANLIVDRGISVVLDVSHFRKAEARRFVTAFAEELFEAKKDNRSPMHLVMEEAQRFIPQHSGAGDKAMLGAFEDLAKIGRNFGIGWSIITQRPQAVNKDVLNQAEPLIVLQSTGTHERKAIRAWIDEQGAEVDDMFTGIAKLQKGEAFFWSPSWLRKLVKIKIGTKRSYDASSTPTAGTKKREPKPLSKRDIEKLGKDIAKVADEAAENDPTALRQRVSKLERELAAAKREQPEPEEIRIEVPVLKEEDLAYVREMSAKFDEAIAAGLGVTKLIEGIASNLETAKVAQSVRRAPRPAVRPLRPRPDVATGDQPDKKLRTGAIKMLAALATMNRDLTRSQVAMLSGMSAKGGSFRTYQSDLRVAGFIGDVGHNIAITEAGVAYLNGNFGDTPRTVREIADLFRSKLRDGAWRMLEALMKRPRDRWSRAELADAAGMDKDGGSFRTYLSDIKRTGIVSTNRQDVGIAPAMLELL